MRLEFDPECFGPHDTMRMLTVLVQRLGGSVVVTQREIEELGDDLDFSLVGKGTDVRVEIRS